MGRITARVQTAVRQRLLRHAGPADLSQVRRVPDRLSWPLQRERFDPVERVGALRAQAPVEKLTSFLGINVWVVTADKEVREVLAHTTAYSNDIRPLLGQGADATSGYIGGLGFTDPPQHTRLRKLLTPEFTMRRLERLRPRITGIVESQLDVLAGAGTDADLVRDFAFPVPFQVICELLGLPVEERETFRSLASARFDVTQGGGQIFGAVAGSREYLLDFTRRQREHPGDGLVGQIIREHGDEISDFDLAGLADGAFTGGLETSASMLALGTAVLLSHPQHYARLASDPAAVDPIVEELLRYLSVVQVAFPRFAKQRMEIGGRTIGAGDVVMCHLTAASRDRRVGLDDRFDPGRSTTTGQLAFGHGFHRCVGAELARMELRIAYPALARRFPAMTLASTDLEFRQRSIVYGVDSLPVLLGSPVPSA